MKIVPSESRGVRVLACEGEMMLGRGDAQLMRACAEALEAGDRRIVLDLTHLAYIDSAGVGAVIASSKRAADRAAVMKIALAADGPVRKVFVITHLYRAFEIFETAAAAVASFSR
jgi:anti-sigma B factor antagonist